MTTKLELEQQNTRLATEVVELRKQLTIAETNLEALKASKVVKAPEEGEDFATFAEAKARMLALMREMPDWKFVQRGTRVVNLGQRRH